LLLKQEGVPMFSMDLSTRECGDQVVVALRGDLDVTAAASAGSGLAAVTDRGRVIIVDLGGLEFIDSSGLAALVLARQHQRHTGGDLLLAGPQRRVLRILTVTRLIDAFSVHVCVADAVASSVRSRPATAVTAAQSALL
jgi:anti-sigma B factor antagonist